MTLVLQPIIWVTNMLGRISEMLDFNPAGSERITDYREDLDKLTEENHIAYRYSDMLACSMNEKNTRMTSKAALHFFKKMERLRSQLT